MFEFAFISASPPGTGPSHHQASWRRLCASCAWPTSGTQHADLRRCQRAQRGRRVIIGEMLACRPERRLIGEQIRSRPGSSIHLRTRQAEARRRRSGILVSAQNTRAPWPTSTKSHLVGCSPRAEATDPPWATQSGGQTRRSPGIYSWQPKAPTILMSCRGRHSIESILDGSFGCHLGLLVPRDISEATQDISRQALEGINTHAWTCQTICADLSYLRARADRY